MTMAKNKTDLPNSSEFEKLFLSTVVFEGAPCLSNCITLGVTPKTFFNPANRILWGVLNALMSEGLEAFDANLIMARMQKDGVFDTFGGLEPLLEVTKHTCSSHGASYLAKELLSVQMRRETVIECRELIAKCQEDSDEDVSTGIGRSLERLSSIVTSNSTEKEPSWEELVEEAHKIQVAYCADGGRPKESIINFPFPEMDDAFEPMQRGQLVIIGATPSSGKSSLLRQVAAQAAYDGKRIYFVTLEVNPVQVVLQLAATASRVSVRALGKCGKDQVDSFTQSLKGLKKLGITISKKDRTIAQIVSKAKALHATKPLDLICIDYGGLIEDIANSSKEEKVASIGRVLKALKRIAVELNCVVVVPWQLNRNSSHENREPRLYDLRDSGDAEQDSDKVIFIHRPAENPLTKQPQDNTSPKNVTPLFYCDLIQAKGRDDGAGRVGINFVRAIASFEPITAPPTQKQAWQGRF
jgi:replicative DNA helicase